MTPERVLGGMTRVDGKTSLNVHSSVFVTRMVCGESFFPIFGRGGCPVSICDLYCSQCSGPRALQERGATSWTTGPCIRVEENRLDTGTPHKPTIDVINFNRQWPTSVSPHRPRIKPVLPPGRRR